MPRARQTITAHTTVFKGFIAGLPEGRKAHNGQTRANSSIVNNSIPRADGDGAGVDRHGSREIPDVGSFSSSTFC